MNFACVILYNTAKISDRPISIVLQIKLGNETPRNKYGDTPLHMAARYNCYEICKHILENVEDRNPVDHFGDTPLDLAKEYNKPKIIDLFNAYNG